MTEKDRRVSTLERDLKAVEKDMIRRCDDLNRRQSDKMPNSSAQKWAIFLVGAVLTLFGLNYNATLNMTATFQDTSSTMVSALTAISERIAKVETTLDERRYVNSMFDDLKKQLRRYNTKVGKIEKELQNDESNRPSHQE